MLIRQLGRGVVTGVMLLAEKGTCADGGGRIHDASDVRGGL